MLLKRTAKRILTMLCSVSILAAVCLPISAAEGEISTTYVKITSDGFVADTMNGVQSRYNLYGPTFYCVELITRYYQELYGLELRATGGAPTVLNNSNYYFEETASPKQGDVMFGSAAARGKGYNHWSLVKSFDGVSVTCFEQNWRWNGQAGINRRIAFPTSYYKFYTLKSKNGQMPKVINGFQPSASSWAESYVDRAAEAGIADLSTDYKATTTRAEFCQMAVNVAAGYGKTAVGTSACEKAQSLGLISAGAVETQPVTREEAAVITARLIDLIGSTPAADGAVLQSYQDSGFISAWAAEAVAKLTTCGLMSGMGGSFNPQGKLTNEQAVTLLVRVSENPNPAPLAATSAQAVTVLAQRSDCAAADLVARSADDMMLSRSYAAY